MVGLPDGEKTLRICVTVYTRCRRVTDRQTDILLRHSRRAVKIGSVVLLFFAALAIGMIGLLTCIHKQRL